MALHTQPCEWTVTFACDSGLADIPETADAELGLMDGLFDKSPGINKRLDLPRSPSGSSMDTALNSPQGSSSSAGTGTASVPGILPLPSSSARAARRLKMEEVFLQFTCDDQDDRALKVADLGTVIRYLGHRLSPSELQRATQEADQDGGGSLDFQEFLCMGEQLDAQAERARLQTAAANSMPVRLFSSPAKSAREQEFRRIFVSCMQTENQTVAVKDLGVVIRLSGYGLTEEELLKVTEEADADGGGSIDYDEFLTVAENLDENGGRYVSK